MSAQSVDLLIAQVIPSDWKQPPEDALDLGAYKQLNVVIDVLSSGTAGNLYVQHAAVRDEAGFKDIANMSALLNTVDKVFISTDAFLRYVRVRSDNVSGGPIAGARAVAKE